MEFQTFCTETLADLGANHSPIANMSAKLCVITPSLTTCLERYPVGGDGTGDLEAAGQTVHEGGGLPGTLIYSVHWKTI